MSNLNIAKIETIIAFKTIKGTSFVGVRNYENSKGEVSNQTFLVGISYPKLLINDLEKLSAFNINDVVKQYPNDRLIVLKAYNEMIASLIKRTSTEAEIQKLRDAKDPTILASDAQKNAYYHIKNGLKAKDNCLYAYGLLIKKTVLVPIDYPTVNSALKTIVKRVITKQAELRGGKFKQFKLGGLETFNAQGFKINKEKFVNS